MSVLAKLLDLEPRWITEAGAPAHGKQGVSFLCPLCRVERIAVFFDRPICGSPAADLKAAHRAEHLRDHHVGATLWQRTGEDFATLTLAPSIDASGFGCFHGFIVNGEVRSC